MANQTYRTGKTHRINNPSADHAIGRKSPSAVMRAFPHEVVCFTSTSEVRNHAATSITIAATRKHNSKSTICVIPRRSDDARMLKAAVSMAGSQVKLRVRRRSSSERGRDSGGRPGAGADERNSYQRRMQKRNSHRQP